MRTLAAGIAIALTLGLVLAGDFAFGLLRRGGEPDPGDFCIAQDARLDHRWKPNCAMRDVWGHRTFDVRTNSLGNRDASVREVPLPRSGSRRAVLIGDSYTVCCLPWDELIVGRMQRLAPGMEFHTAGMMSWSPTLYGRRVRELLDAGFQFDDLVVMIDISDVQDEAAVYGVDSAGRLYDLGGRTRQEQTGQPNDRMHDVLQRLAASRKLRRWLPLTHALVQRLAWHEPAAGEIPDVDRGAWTYATDPAIEKRAYGPLGYAGGIAKEMAAMDELASRLAAAGVRLHVVVYPWPQQLLHDRADSRQVRMWRAWCERARCASFVDVFAPLFAAKAHSPGWYAEYFIPGDIHYNAHGNDLIAAAIVAAIRP